MTISLNVVCKSGMLVGEVSAISHRMSTTSKLESMKVSGACDSRPEFTVALPMYDYSPDVPGPIMNEVTFKFLHVSNFGSEYQLFMGNKVVGNGNLKRL